MLHNPWSMVAGDSEELRKRADHLDQLKESLVATYKRRFKDEDVSAIMDAETWMTAEQAVEKGVADRIRAGRPSAMAFVQGEPTRNRSRYLIAAKADPQMQKMIEQAKEQAEALCNMKEEKDAIQAIADNAAEELRAKSDLLQSVENEKSGLEKERDILQVRIDGMEQDTARRIALAAHEPVEQSSEPGQATGLSAYEQYKAIADKATKAEFFRNNKAEIFRTQPKGA